MNSADQSAFNSVAVSRNVVSRSVEFNSDGLKIMVKTPKCCKKVIINDVQSCDVQCCDKDCNGKSMTCENKCTVVQETINKNTSNKKGDSIVNVDNERNLDEKSKLRKSGDSNVVNEVLSTNLETLIDKHKNLKVVVDKSIVDKYISSAVEDRKAVIKLNGSGFGTEMASSNQHKTLSRDCSNQVSIPLEDQRTEDRQNCHNKDTVKSNHVMDCSNHVSETREEQPMKGTQNCDNKDTVEKNHSLDCNNHVSRPLEEHSVKSQQNCESKDAAEIDKCVFKKRHSTKPLKNSNSALMGMDPKIIVRTFNMSTKKHTPEQKISGVLSSSSIHQVSNNSNSIVDSNHVLLLDPNRTVLLKQPQPVILNSNSTNKGFFIVNDLAWKSVAPRVTKVCSYCSRSFQKRDAQTQTNSCSPSPIDIKNGVIIGRVDSSCFGNGIKNGKLVYINKDKIINRHNNNLNKFRKILPQPQLKAVYHPNFVKETGKENKDLNGMSDSHSLGPVADDGNCLENSSCLLTASPKGDSEVAPGQLQMNVVNMNSSSATCQDILSKSINQGLISDQSTQIVNKRYVSSEDQCQEIVVDIFTGFKSKDNSVEPSTSHSKSNDSSYKESLVEGSINLCKDSLVKSASSSNLLSDSCESLTTVDNHHDNELFEKPCLNQEKKLNRVMWPTSRSVVQKKPNHEELNPKVFRTLYEDWLNCLKEDEEGNLPLHRAVLSNNVAAVTRQTIILKKYEASSNCVAVNHQNKEGDTALMIAAGIRNIKEDIVALLVHKFHVDQTERNMITGDTALHIAARNGNVKCVRLLLSAQGAKEVVNLFNDEGLAPLHLAARHGHSDVIRELVDMEADINLKDKRGGYTPLYHAFNGDHRDAYTMLLGLGAETNDSFLPAEQMLSSVSESVGISESPVLCNAKKRKQKVNADKSSDGGKKRKTTEY